MYGRIYSINKNTASFYSIFGTPSGFNSVLQVFNVNDNDAKMDIFSHWNIQMKLLGQLTQLTLNI